MKFLFSAGIISLFFFANFVLAAHYVVGYAEDAKDGTSVNGRTAVIWKTSVGIQDNATDIIGISGDSGTDNYYLIDCEMLSSSCNVGDNISVGVINDGTDYVGRNNITLIVTGSGFDYATSNLTINSPLVFEFFSVDDSFSFPLGEIDLLAGSTTTVSCVAIIKDYDGKVDLSYFNSTFYNSTSSFGFADSNKGHYTNSSCFRNDSYGNENETQIVCNFPVNYYASPGNWTCNMSARDNYSKNIYSANSTKVNELLSIDLSPILRYGPLTQEGISTESVMNVSNAGNVKINLSLIGYGVFLGDNNSLVCNLGKNISIDNEKFNLTQSTSGNITYGELSSKYENLTNSSKIKNFGLDSRDSDIIDDAIKSTYWRVYIPKGVTGNCTGNIVFGATVSPEN